MVNIVLVNPEIPQNTGNIARTCAVTGSHLHLIEPMGFAIDDAKLKRAGLDYWHLLDITYYSSIDDYLSRTSGAVRLLATTKTRRLYTEADYPDGCHILLGCETHGLPSELLAAYPRDCIRIPQLGDARCLNLSNAAAVICYEALRQQGFAGMN